MYVCNSYVYVCVNVCMCKRKAVNSLFLVHLRLSIDVDNSKSCKSKWFLSKLCDYKGIRFAFLFV